MLKADARSIPLPDDSVDCCVTSPPYYARRIYGEDPREIGGGNGGDLQQYLSDLDLVWAEVARVLKPTGTFWLNISDTSASSGGGGGDHNPGGSKADIPKYRQGDTGLRGSQWCLVPYRVALSLQSTGWMVRMPVIWSKNQRKPESAAHVRRPREELEHIFMLVRHKSYRYYHEREVEPGNIWTFPPARGARRHFAPFPEELPRRCILLSTEPGDTVLDPFAGSGTTVRIAESLGRVGIGLELYA